MTGVVQYESGSNPNIVLTDAAIKHLLSYLAKQGSKGIRLSVKKTGCSGLSYVLDYIQTPLNTDIVQVIKEDLIICVDKTSYPYLKGIQIDYVKQGLNSKFVFNNPNQTGQCGCGESFTVG